ncbi:hypothetical protein [Deinococcus multiflagellatus]|uniref:Uncharacterized protein n=1 Tax=Deinococcus multiflagellatus TaxID=1656887 RepID=A0ABW1ZJJ4_9DEIO
MKKALMTAVAMTLGVASAASSSSTNLNFRTTVVSGCAVAMNPSYTNSVVPTYNGTMGTPRPRTSRPGPRPSCAARPVRA